MATVHTATVLYPGDTTFNMEYYLSSHMPMVLEKLKVHGMTGYRISKIEGNADGSAASFSVEAQLLFTNSEDMPKAFSSPEAESVLADIPNFADKKPIIMAGSIVGTGGNA